VKRTCDGRFVLLDDSIFRDVSILYLLCPDICQSSPGERAELTHNRQALKTARMARSVSAFRRLNGKDDIFRYCAFKSDDGGVIESATSLIELCKE
jgi:hypothetical protein